MTTVYLCGHSAEEWTKTYEPVESSGFNGYVYGPLTLSLSVTNFKGIINIEGSISENWFLIKSIKYPIDFVVNSSNGGYTGTNFFKLDINCEKIRLNLYRDHIMQRPSDEQLIIQFGCINSALIKY